MGDTIRFGTVSLIFACIFPLFSPLQAEMSYQAVDLGGGIANYSHALTINEEGKVFGILNFEGNPKSTNHQFFTWSKEQGIAIHWRPTKWKQTDLWGSPNRLGQIAFGKWHANWFHPTLTLFLWDPITGVEQLGQPFASISEGIVLGPMNGLKQMVLQKEPDQTNPWKFAVWDGKKITPFSSSLLETVDCITDQSEVVGTRKEAALYGAPTLLIFFSLSDHTIREYPIYASITPLFANETGAVSGVLHNEKGSCPETFLWTKEGLRTIPQFEATAMNDLCHIAGLFYPHEGAYPQPALWADGSLILLNQATDFIGTNWHAVLRIMGLNNQGEMVGLGKTSTNALHAILLTPKSIGKHQKYP